MEKEAAPSHKVPPGGVGAPARRVVVPPASAAGAAEEAAPQQEEGARHPADVDAGPDGDEQDLRDQRVVELSGQHVGRPCDGQDLGDAGDDEDDAGRCPEPGLGVPAGDAVDAPGAQAVDKESQEGHGHRRQSEDAAYVDVKGHLLPDAAERPAVGLAWPREDTAEPEAFGHLLFYHQGLPAEGRVLPEGQDAARHRRQPAQSREEHPNQLQANANVRQAFALCLLPTRPL
ncbi:hypothetical protein scyTo_0026675 [Scyliorhinus torazame]|uniref:Uncharacterized protein n=1 Tax=Scyliorhinus torazame TaxID=75743 RepID=A0A401QKN0_SCYTO|nr:hypothetical protein [Scyliorhinus torazame]